MIKPKPVLAAIFFILILLSFGCAPLQPPADMVSTHKAETMAMSIRQFNQQISASKGMGWLTIESQEQSFKYKLAWAAEAPNRLRATLLTSGLPFETIVATGKKTLFVSHTGSHEPYTTRSTDPDLDEIIKVPVRLSDLLSLLLGRLPIKDYDVAQLSYKDPSMKTLILKKQWNPTRQKVVVNDQGLPGGLDFFDNKGQLLYSVKIVSYNKKIPAHIEVTDNQQRKIQLKIIGFQENPQIKPTVFQLTPNGS